jgi:hypothetical protein
MYPIEVGNIIDGNTTEEIIIENTEELTGEIKELTGTFEELTGNVEEMTGENNIEANSGDHESAVDFGELNDL